MIRLPFFKRDGVSNTSFRAGGLIIEPKLTSTRVALLTPEGFTRPPYIDSRPYVLPASNQGQNPFCAAYATAGWAEAHNWRLTGISSQINPDPIYKRAKELDGSPNTDGTTLTAAVDAAKALRVLPEYEYRVIDKAEQVPFAMHRHGVIIAGFAITEGWNRVRGGWIGRERNPLGGHAVLIDYYDPDGVGIMNSWGVTWGVKGRAKLTWRQFSDQFLYGVVLQP